MNVWTPTPDTITPSEWHGQSLGCVARLTVKSGGTIFSYHMLCKYLNNFKNLSFIFNFLLAVVQPMLSIRVISVQSQASPTHTAVQDHSVPPTWI